MAALPPVWPALVICTNADMLRWVSPLLSPPPLSSPPTPHFPPDKFVARFGQRLAAEDRDRILARVARTAQQLTAISSTLK